MLDTSRYFLKRGILFLEVRSFFNLLIMKKELYYKVFFSTCFQTLESALGAVSCPALETS